MMIDQPLSPEAQVRLRERRRRERVVKGWMFKELSDAEQKAILRYVHSNGPVPEGYEQIDRVIR